MTAIIGGLRAKVTDADLVRLSAMNPGWKFERSDNGDILVSPTSTKGGGRSAEALGQLYIYAKRVGGKVYDSSTGFKTPGGGVISPDAGWVRAARVATMDDQTYQSLMPDIVIEVASASDSWPAVARPGNPTVCEKEPCHRPWAAVCRNSLGLRCRRHRQ